jgi:hypothetical protein
MTEVWSAVGGVGVKSGSSVRCQPSRHWTIRNARAFFAHGAQTDSIVDPQGMPT